MLITKRALISGGLVVFASECAFAGRPDTFDFWNYVRRERERRSLQPHEHFWLPATVEAINFSRRKITIFHVPEPGTGMRAMRMTFALADNVDVRKLRAGAAVEIQVDEHDGRVSVIGIRLRE